MPTLPAQQQFGAWRPAQLTLASPSAFPPLPFCICRLSAALQQLEGEVAAGADQLHAESSAAVLALERQLAAEAQRAQQAEAALAEAEQRAEQAQRERELVERSMGSEIEGLQAAMQVGGVVVAVVVCVCVLVGGGTPLGTCWLPGTACKWGVQMLQLPPAVAVPSTSYGSLTFLRRTPLKPR